MPATCQIVSATLDKAQYAAGETMTLTVIRKATTGGTTATPLTITVAAVAADGTQAEPVTTQVTLDLPTAQASSVSVSDDSGRVWTAGDDDGVTAVFTAIA